MSKGKTIQPKFAVVLALAVVLVLIWYGYKAEWFKDVGVENTGAVAAVSSTDKPAKGASAGISSGKPTIAVTSWPTFEMKYNGAGQENNLVVKAEYSITATTKKIFIPATWGNLWIRNTAYQGANPTKIEVKSLDALSLTNCNYVGSCYVIPSGKTVRFVVRQVYNPLVMFGGLYSGQLSYLHYLTDSSNGNFYYTQFPAQTSKLNTITVVGEKSPYVYTTVVETQSSQPFTIKGVRLTGASPFIEGNSNPENVISRSDTEMTLAIKTTPGVYSLYLNHPTYGKSNRIQLTVKKTGYPEVTFVSSDETVNTEDGADNDTGIFTIKYRVEAVGGPIYVSDRAKALAGNTVPSGVSDGAGVLYTIGELGLNPSTSGLSSIVTFTTSGGASDSGVYNGVYLQEGEETEMTLTVAKTNLGNSTDDGIYQVHLRGIGWSLIDSPTFQIYQPKGIEDYKTDPVTIN
ncbi:MAG: hypothetical protein KBC48_01875 [Candidatus Pacebacteria bacterium]|nr:hypothetical protein [Candidatus Paceibacterota bacterium]